MLARASILALLFSILPGAPAQAQADPLGATVLKAVTVKIVSANYRTLQAGVCHGAVYATVNSIAYVITAKHCVETLSSTPLVPGIKWRDIHEIVTVQF